MDSKYATEKFAKNDEFMFREYLDGYEHSKDSSQKELFYEVNEVYTITIVHFLSFNDIHNDCCILNIINNETGKCYVNMPSPNFRKLLKYMNQFRY